MSHATGNTYTRRLAARLARLTAEQPTTNDDDDDGPTLTEQFDALDLDAHGFTPESAQAIRAEERRYYAKAARPAPAPLPDRAHAARHAQYAAEAQAKTAKLTAQILELLAKLPCPDTITDATTIGELLARLA